MELQEWARAYRYYTYYSSSAGYAYTYTNGEGDIEEDENTIDYMKDVSIATRIAQIHAKYAALSKTSDTTTLNDEMTALTNLGVTCVKEGNNEKNSLAARFTAGYFVPIQQKVATKNGELDDYTKCYVSREINGTGCPDAMGFVTWWVDCQSTYRDSILVTKPTSADADELNQSTLRMVGGFAYSPSDSTNFTYATLDIFALR
jgi:hypothetical protein